MIHKKMLSSRITKEEFAVMQSVIYALTKHEAYDNNRDDDNNFEDTNVSLLSKPHCDNNFILHFHLNLQRRLKEILVMLDRHNIKYLNQINVLLLS